MAPPKIFTEYFTSGDVGKRLTDPAYFQEALSALMGWQNVVASAVSPGPLLSMRTNLITGGTGALFVQLPFAAAGRLITVANLAHAPVVVTVQLYNPAIGGADIAYAPPGGIPIGNVYSYLAFQPGYWVMFSTTSQPVIDGETC